MEFVNKYNEYNSMRLDENGNANGNQMSAVMIATIMSTLSTLPLLLAA